MADEPRQQPRSHTAEAQQYQPSPIEETLPDFLTTIDEPREHRTQGEATAQTHQYAYKPAEATAAPLLDAEKVAMPLKGWPASPKTVRSSLWMFVWNGIFDLLLFTCAVAFLAFASIVSQYDQASTVENPRTTGMLINATKYVRDLKLFVGVWADYGQGPTVFPILFALILGRATHTILRWRLERGEHIGVLDTLAASTSLTSTVVSQFQLRAISAFGIVLVSVWALSPIGGQASIRQMTIGTKNTTQLSDFDYFVHNGYFVGFLDSGRDSSRELVNTLFVSAIIGSIASKSSWVDIWGNVKIPRIEHYEAKTVPDSEGWFDTVGGSLDSYTSAIGIPMSGMNSTDFVDYKTSIQTPYLQTTCSFTKSSDRERYLYPAVPQGMVNFTGPGAVIMFDNETQMRRAYSDPEDLDQFQFRYLTRLWNMNNHQLDCNISTSYVETEINCLNSTLCMATKIRRSRLDTPPAAWTMLDLHWDNPTYLFTEVLNSVRGRSGWPTLLDRYMSNPDSLVKLSGNATLASVPLTTEENYSVRMSQLLNSYFTIINGLYTIAGGLNNETADFTNKTASFMRPVNSKNDTRYKPDEILWYQFLPTGASASLLKGRVWSARGTKGTSKEVIIAHKPWVITLCITSIVLIFASLVSPLIHLFFIRGPEVLMNISSLATRHNPYIPLPDGGTHLGASARAQLLKRLEVRFGDIEGGSNVGRLVIGALKDAGEQDLTRVKKGRLYE